MYQLKSSCQRHQLNLYFNRMVFLIVMILMLKFHHFSANNTDFERVLDNEILNLEVDSKIDLTGRFVRVHNTVVFKSPNIHKYKYIVNETEPYHIEFTNKNGKIFNYEKSEISVSTILYEITLNEELMGNGNFYLHCKLAYASRITPAVKQRSINEDQLMKYEGNLLFLSPYPTRYLKVSYLLKSNSLVEVTETPKQTTDDLVLYEFYNLTSYCDETRIELIFNNNDAFLVVKTLYRTIDINHFGRITVRDDVELENNGPKFTGPYAEKPEKGRTKAATSWLYTHLPASADNIRFFDILGNSSKTAVYDLYNFKTLKFKTRYPLLGGWKTSYTLQYQLPAHEYLRTLRNHYWLKIRSVDHVIDDRYIEKAVVRILLPEGAVFDAIRQPRSLDLENDEFGCHTALCVFGRHAVVMSGRNLFETYEENVTIQYFFNPLFLLRVPLVVGAYVQGLFLVALCVRRFVV